MAYNDIMHKTELAAQAVAAAVVTSQSLNSYVGLEDDAQALPSVTFAAESVEPVIAGQIHGNRFVTLAVTIRSTRDGTGAAAAHRGKVEAVFDVFMDDTLPAMLSAGLADFYCFTAEYLGESQNVIDRSHLTSIRFRLLVAPSDIT